MAIKMETDRQTDRERDRQTDRECFDTVGWVTGRASSLLNISHQLSPKFLHRETFRGVQGTRLNPE